MRKLINTLLQFLALAIVLFGVHAYIIVQFFLLEPAYFPLWGIYLFNSLMVVAVLSIVFVKTLKGYTKGYQLFLTLTLIKMVLALVFLLPLFFGKAAAPRFDVVNFFVPYFIFLGFEIWVLNRFFQQL